jgi:putative toxin-antitoxin system antitoxin component (TIGR02293 family)
MDRVVYADSVSSESMPQTASDILKSYYDYYRSPVAKLKAIRRGLESTAIVDLMRVTGATQVDLAHILSLTEPTLRKYIKERRELNTGVSEHIIQLFELFDKGMDTFGSLEEFKNWLPHHNIGINAKPIELLDTITGINMVMNELRRIDYGVLA